LIFHILTLFPEIFEAYLKTSIIGRSIEEGRIKVNLVNIRDYTKNKHKKVDDTTYGGGPGMIMSCEPLYNAISSVYKESSKLIFLTPQGKVYRQDRARELAKEQEIILVSGHYEGFDHRIYELFPHEKLSIGDYILTNGGPAAMVVLDSVTRTRDDVLGNPESASDESFSHGLLEHAQYTRPPDFMGHKVPDVLLGGHHKLIERFRRESSLSNTLSERPELIEQTILTQEDIEYIIRIIEEN